MATGIAHTNLKILKSYAIPIPPISEQKEFIEKTNQLEQEKEKQKYSECRFEILFHSLQQRAFRGEL